MNMNWDDWVAKKAEAVAALPVCECCGDPILPEDQGPPIMMGYLVCAPCRRSCHQSHFSLHGRPCNKANDPGPQPEPVSRDQARMEL